MNFLMFLMFLFRVYFELKLIEMFKFFRYPYVLPAINNEIIPLKTKVTLCIENEKRILCFIIRTFRTLF
jgi:hypothetical protein